MPARRVLIGALALASILRGVAYGDTLAITKVVGLQPGWVRVTVAFDTTASSPDFDLTPSCAGGTSVASSHSSTLQVDAKAKTAWLDLRVDLDWLTDNGLPSPCHVTGLTVMMRKTAVVLASTTLAIDVPLDLPLAGLHPKQITGPIAAASVALDPAPESRRHAAYPPRLLAVRTASGRLAFLEVEELPSRGSVGLRGLATYVNDTASATLEFELGGGAEVFPAWGVDVDELGVTKTDTPAEVTNPGHDEFPYASAIQPPILNGTPGLRIFPAPPIFAESDFLTDVLNNRGVTRCEATACRLDVVYDVNAHALVAANGATLLDLDAGPIVMPGGMQLARSVAVETASPARDTAPSPGDTRVLDPKAGRALVRQTLKLRSRRTLRNVDLDAKRLGASLGDTGVREPSRLLEVIARDPSPQEQAIADLAAAAPRGGVLIGIPAASCVLNANGRATAGLSPCNGFSALGFRCPTLGDPIRPEKLPRPPTRGRPKELSLVGLIPPYYAGRNNIVGTCASHAFAQYLETLLARFTDDLAPKRVVYVDGLPVTVPVPAIAVSIAGGLWNLYDWSGTRLGDRDLGDSECNLGSALGSACAVDTDCPGDFTVGRCGPPWPDASVPMMPVFVDAYWPAREGVFPSWIATHGLNAATQRCQAKGQWWSGFCMAEGHPPPGVYRNYSQMVASFGADAPLSDPPWSLAATYMNVVTSQISIANRDQAIKEVIAEIQRGFPVMMGFASNYTLLDVSGGQVTPANSVGWYLPPELGACSVDALNAALKPGGGHAVNIVGYALSGSRAKPNPFNSYFILENNWGKNAGYRSFFFMNFAAFKYLVNSLVTYRLDRACLSRACATPLGKLKIPNAALRRILFPPDPVGPVGPLYGDLIGSLMPFLDGQATQTGTPMVPGISSASPFAPGSTRSR